MSALSKINWEKIDTVFFDMDGTLLDLHFDNQFWLKYVPQQYAIKNGLSFEASEKKLLAKYKTMEGKLEWYCIDHWSEQLDLNILQLKRDCSSMISIRPGVEPLLQKIQQAGKCVILATNAHPDTMHLKLEVSLLHHHFDHLINSHQLGFPKEQVEFWQELNKKIPYNPKRSLFVDDNLGILATAQQYGIRYCLGIKQPDSKGDFKESDDFMVIDRFEELYELI